MEYIKSLLLEDLVVMKDMVDNYVRKILRTFVEFRK